MYKKIAGYWRDDKTLQDVIVDNCPECGKSLNWSCWEWCYAEGEDEKLLEAWSGGEWEMAFCYDHVVTGCEHCDLEFDLGNWYYNPDGDVFNLSRPVMPDVAIQLDAQHEREAQIEAGQLELI